MKPYKYKTGKKLYRIRRYFKNKYIVGGYIESCKIISRYTNTPVEPWYFIETKDQTITWGENELYETESEARLKLEDEIKYSLNRLEKIYKETKQAIEYGINNITTKQ